MRKINIMCQQGILFMANDPTKQKSLKLNMMLNMVKSIVGIIFPLISFPYASKVLGVDNIGKYGFANSVIGYFLMLSDLGITTYAIRECAKVRTDKEKVSALASELFSIHCLSSACSLILLVICIMCVPKIRNYQIFLIIMSLQILFRPIGLDWLYSVYEEYIYITIRTVCFQSAALVLLFLLVKTKQDVIVYTSINVVTNVFKNILNFLQSKKICKIKFTFRIHYKAHMKAILILFFMNLTISIYVASDTTILGFMCNDYTVGIYSLSAQIYSVVKTIISSVLIVSIPRLSTLIKNKREFVSLADNLYKTILSVTLPAIVGLILLRREIILIAADETFLQAESSLILLCIALFFCMGGWFWGQCVIIPFQKENYLFGITLISASVNVIFNLILIPIGKENAAAFTTILAEGITFIGLIIVGKAQICLRGISKIIIKIFIGCIGIIICKVMMAPLRNQLGVYFVGTICLSVIVYSGIEAALGNEVFTEIFLGMQKRLKHMIAKRDR